MTYILTTDELYHHGILGQKWGVRRYQNYDGSYTQAGLKRYNEAKDKYEKAKSSGKDYHEIHAAKKELKKAYETLKKDYLADEGRKLYKKGDRIYKNVALEAAAGIGSHLGSTAIEKYSQNRSNKILLDNRYGDEEAYSKVNKTRIAGLASSAALSLASSGFNWSRMNSSKKLKEYYKHEEWYDSGIDFVKKVITGKL